MLVLVGKMCSGKNTIRDILVDEYGMEPVLTHTTRPPRDGEENYIDYIFINDTHFKNLKEDGWFAETTSYNVASGDTWYYGSAVHDYENGQNKIIILNPEGLKEVEKRGIPVFAIYLLAPESAIRDRAKKRGDPQDEVERRIKADNEDFYHIEDYIDGTIVNFSHPELVAKEVYKVYHNYLKRNGMLDVDEN